MARPAPPACRSAFRGVHQALALCSPAAPRSRFITATTAIPRSIRANDCVLSDDAKWRHGRWREERKERRQRRQGGNNKRAGRIEKTGGRGRRAASPPVSPVVGAWRSGARLALVNEQRLEEGAGAAKTFEERELARMMYNRESAKLSVTRKASRRAALLAEKQYLEAAYQMRLAQVALLNRVIANAEWAVVELPCMSIES